MPNKDSFPDPGCSPLTDLEKQVGTVLKSLPVAGERAGILYQNKDGTYCYTEPTSTDHDNFDISAHYPKGAKLVALYHSHSIEPGDVHVDENFSPDDLDQAEKLGVPSYIRILRTGEMKKYIPGITKTIKENVVTGVKGGRKRISKGDTLMDKD